MTQLPQINDRVVRVQPGDYTNGRTGTVVEVDELRGRVRVAWDRHPRTWVKISRIELDERVEKFKVFFSGGPGTSPERYQVGELFETREKAEAYIKMYDHSGAIWTIETVLV